MLGKLLNFPKKQDSTKIEFKVAQIEIGSNKLENLKKLHSNLKQKEAGMKNPILKDWFAIRNDIRYLEKRIRELQYEFDSKQRN